MILCQTSKSNLRYLNEILHLYPRRHSIVMDTVSIFRLSHLSKLLFWMLLYGPPAHTSVVFQCNHMLTILKLCENLLPGKSCSTSRTVPQCAFVSALCMACLSPEVNTNRTQYETLDMNHNSYVCLTYPSDKIKTKQSHIVHCRDRPREIKPPFVMFSYVEIGRAHV